MKKLAFIALLAFAVGCDECAPTSTSTNAQSDAGTTVHSAPPAHSDAGTTSLSAPPTSAREVVVFNGAAGWEGGRVCTDVNKDDGCSSQWLHVKSGQVVRVFVVDIAEERALDTFVEKLAADVATKGGVVDRFTQNGLTLVRFLQPVKNDDGTQALAAINYALVGRDKRAVHLITSIVAFEAQQESDTRVRELLEHASWAQ